MAGMAGMAEWQKEWQNSKMAEMATFVLFMVHTDDDTDDDDDDDTLIFYSIDILQLLYINIEKGIVRSYFPVLNFAPMGLLKIRTSDRRNSTNKLTIKEQITTSVH
jgi:hypothetical protein